MRFPKKELQRLKWVEAVRLERREDDPQKTEKNKFFSRFLRSVGRNLREASHANERYFSSANFTAARQVHEEESLSQSSDEKMDTSSESFRSQDTPNSNLSSEFDDKSETHVLRLQNPENGVLRLSEPQNDNVSPKQQLTDSFLLKMSELHLDSPLRPRNLVLSEGKKTTLVLTTNHPLMVTSPDDYPDLIPKKLAKDDQDLSLSSIEDEKPAGNGFELYSPNTNNSKNNLYYSDNFTTASEVQSMVESRPDVARVQQKRRKIIPRFVDTPPKQSAASRLDNADQRVHASTPKTSFDEPEDHDPRINQWSTSTQVRPAPNFDLPIELTTNIAVDNVLDSPDVLSSSTRSPLSPYEAHADPATGRVSLRPPARAASHSPHTPRRKIEIPEEDRCSLDSVSVSMESEDEPPELDPQLVIQEEQSPPSDEEVKRCKSPNTCSECSDPIPEYSAAEEFHNERSYVSVHTGHTHATCDMKVIEPYKRVLSHGGYDPQGSAIIVFSACHLPDTARTDYRYVMDNLFLYVMWTLDRLIGSEYVLVYLHGSAGARRLPSCRWLLECYRLVDHRLRKSLKHLYLVHPTFWLKSFVLITKPFVSSKFFRKLTYVHDLDQLSRLVPVQTNAIPDIVKQYDAQRR